MILVDTSVLINWLREKQTNGAAHFQKLIDNDTDFSFSILTYQEILQGVRSAEQETKLRKYLESRDIIMLPDDLDFYCGVARTYRTARSNGETIRSGIDLMIAHTAMRYNLRLLHDDKDFDIIAKFENGLKIY